MLHSLCLDPGGTITWRRLGKPLAANAAGTVPAKYDPI